MSSDYRPFPYEQPHPPADPEAGRNLRPPRESGPQPTPSDGEADRMPRHGDLYHLGFTLHAGKKRAS